jgi:hypothetical protein
VLDILPELGRRTVWSDGVIFDFVDIAWYLLAVPHIVVKHHQLLCLLFWHSSSNLVSIFDLILPWSWEFQLPCGQDLISFGNSALLQKLLPVVWPVLNLPTQRSLIFIWCWYTPFVVGMLGETIHFGLRAEESQNLFVYWHSLGQHILWVISIIFQLSSWERSCHASFLQLQWWTQKILSRGSQRWCATCGSRNFIGWIHLSHCVVTFMAASCSWSTFLLKNGFHNLKGVLILNTFSRAQELHLIFTCTSCTCGPCIIFSLQLACRYNSFHLL